MSSSTLKAVYLAFLGRMPWRREKVPAPPSPGTVAALPKGPANWIGSMVGTGRILGDIVSPAADENDWEVLR